MGAFSAEASEDLAALLRRVAESFLGRCVLRFLRMAGIDRCIVLSSQAFTALIPLLILVASVAPAGQESSVADSLIRRFALTGDSAAAVEALFMTPAGSTGSLSVFSALLLLFSGVSFTRRMQKMYRAAWEQEWGGVRSGLFATLGLVALLAEMAIAYGAMSLARHLPLAWLWAVPLQALTGLVLWTSIPYLLMNRQVHWRRLLVGGTTAALGTTAFGIATTIYMPSLMNHYTNEFGLFGITIAIIGWLLAVSGILVASTAIGAEFDAARGPRLVAFKSRFGLHDPRVDIRSATVVTAPSGLTRSDLVLLLRVLRNWLVLSFAVWVATALVPGIEVAGGFLAYLALALLFGLVNAVLGPLLQLVAMPMSILTLGSFALVVNGVLLAVTAGLSSLFAVGGLGDAILGALVIAVVTTMLELVVRPAAGPR